MRIIIAIPLLMLAVMLQSSFVSQTRLLAGYADLILILLAAWALQERVSSGWHWALLASVLTGFVTRLPWLAVAIGYSSVVLIARVLSRRVWQAPLLAMFGVTFLGTLLMHLETFAVLRFMGTPLHFVEVLALITLPSLLLNMLLAIPLYPGIRDLANWVYPSPEAT